MLFLGLPDVPVQMMDTHPTYVAAITTNDHTTNQENFGYCMIADDSMGGVVDITWPFYDLIPKRIQKALDDSGQLGTSVLEPNDADWLAEWQKSFTIKILRQPAHGDIRSGEGSLGYMPKEGYLGKDRVDVQIEGKAPDGRLVSARANVFIRAVSNDKRSDLLGSSNKMSEYIKQNCPAPTEFWKIDNKPVSGALEGEKATDKLSISPSLANQVVSGFVNLDGASLAQTAGTGSSAHTAGWHIDYTPYLNNKYLPVSSVIESLQQSKNYLTKN